MQRDEKVLDMALEAFAQRLNELKASLAQTLHKLEMGYEDLTWPSLLDSFALLSGQLNTLLRVLRNEKTPALRHRVTLPLLLSLERDEQLATLTEQRVPAFTHDLVPLYLRTKAEPSVEQRHLALENRAATTSTDSTQKQVTTMNKVVNNLLDTVTQVRDDWAADASRCQLAQTSSLADTQALIAAVGTGKGLKPAPVIRPTAPPIVNPTNVQAPTTHKAPSTVRTNIKTNVHGHPYK